MAEPRWPTVVRSTAKFCIILSFNTLVPEVSLTAVMQRTPPCDNTKNGWEGDFGPSGKASRAC